MRRLVLPSRVVLRASWWLLLLLAYCGLRESTVSAQEWARSMFSETQHDFGAVARGAKAEIVFEMTNKFKEDIHIASVRASCGCATPSIIKDTLKTWEKGGIRTVYNTNSFLGRRTATITVVIDRPYYAEVQLSVQGYIRSDVVFSPGMVSFGEVAQGQPSEQQVSVLYAGRPSWQITDVRSANSDFEVELKETQRLAGQVRYNMVVRLKGSSPTGFLKDELTIVTNDTQRNRIPLSVEGRVRSPLTVSPASLFLGELKPGDTVTKRLRVLAKTPFRITDVQCDDGCFEFTPSKEAKRLHVIPVVFTADDKRGKVAETIRISTDLGGAVAECLATGTIQVPAKTAAQE